MKIHKVSGNEIDERLSLDKRHDSRAFSRCFESSQELPFSFHDLQDEIRDGLEKQFWKNFDDGVDRSKFASWKMPVNEYFYFPSELLNCEQIRVEISNEILSDKLIGLIVAYLEKTPSPYTLVAAVYKGMERGSEFLGRFVINVEEIAIESSLYDVWQKQVQFMEIV